MLAHEIVDRDHLDGDFLVGDVERFGPQRMAAPRRRDVLAVSLDRQVEHAFPDRLADGQRMVADAGGLHAGSIAFIVVGIGLEGVELRIRQARPLTTGEIRRKGPQFQHELRLDRPGDQPAEQFDQPIVRRIAILAGIQVVVRRRLQQR